MVTVPLDLVDQHVTKGNYFPETSETHTSNVG